MLISYSAALSLLRTTENQRHRPEGNKENKIITIKLGNVLTQHSHTHTHTLTHTHSHTHTHTHSLNHTHSHSHTLIGFLLQGNKSVLTEFVRHCICAPVAVCNHYRNVERTTSDIGRATIVESIHSKYNTNGGSMVVSQWKHHSMFTTNTVPLVTGTFLCSSTLIHTNKRLVGLDNNQEMEFVLYPTTRKWSNTNEEQGIT